MDELATICFTWKQLHPRLATLETRVYIRVCFYMDHCVKDIWSDWITFNFLEYVAGYVGQHGEDVNPFLLSKTLIIMKQESLYIQVPTI